LLKKQLWKNTVNDGKKIRWNHMWIISTRLLNFYLLFGEMPDINNIETLQSKVDLVKNDLDALKQETNEWTKKTKTEAIEKNVTAAKEAITKKLEELKKLGEAANKTDIDKLEALLATLDSLTTLKIAVTAPVEVSKNNEAVDNFADFESITKGIAELKTMSIELKTLIDEYT